MHKRRRGFKKKIVFMLVIAAIFPISLGAFAQEEDASEPLISLNVNEMSIYDVLRLTAEQADLNMVIKEIVRGEITLRVKNANLWQVLEVILEDMGFTYQKEDGIIIIVELEEVKEEAAKEKPFPVTEIIFLNYLPAREVKEICQHFLSPSGFIEAESRVNALILIDAPENIRKIQQLIARLDIRLSQFVLNGIISDSDSSLAMINGEILRLGETIEGVTVSKIKRNTVTLKKEDLVIVLVLR